VLNLPAREALAQQNGMAYFETSARKGQGVNEAFESIARQVVERLGREPKQVADAAVVVADDKAGKKAGAGCCGGK
jgi:GTPase SAR1 family protein